MLDDREDLNDVLLGFTNYVQNERVRSYNEGFDAAMVAAWMPIDSAPKDGSPVQVTSDDGGHNWLPMTAYCCGGDRWERPASRDGLPYAPTHWRALPSSPRRAA